MGGSELTSYCLALAGLVLVASGLVGMLRRSIQVDAAQHALARLAEAGDMDRLVALCAIGPRTYLAAVSAAATAADPKATFDATAARLDVEWRHLADRGLTGTVLAIGAALVAWNAGLWLVGVWTVGALATACGVYFLLRRGAAATALDRARHEIVPLLGRVPEAPPKAAPDTGVTRAPAGMLALLTKGKLSFATPRKPSLRDGTCPLCDHATVLTVVRRDTRFTSYVCAACGYAQDFADLAKL